MASTDDPIIAAMLRERDGYLRVGKTDRAAMVTAELKRRGFEEFEEDEPRRTPPQGRTGRPARQTTSRTEE